MENGDVLIDVTPAEIDERTTNLMHVYQIIRIFSNACDRKNIDQIKKLSSKYTILQQNEVLKSLNKKTFATSKTKDEFKSQVIDSMLNLFIDMYQNEKSDLMFLSAAKFEVNKLKEIILDFKKDFSTYLENINQTRYSDSAIIFGLKYGNVMSSNFLQCMIVLTDAGVDINMYDINGKTAIDYIALLYDYNKDNTPVSETLKNIAQLFLDKGIYPTDNKKTNDFLEKVMEIELSTYSYAPMDDKIKLFYWIIKNKTHEFLEFKQISKFANSDNGENTLLQLASKKSDNMLPIVQFLLKNGADPNKVTRLNKLTPLELAATNNNQKIFEEILKNKKTEITQKQYNNFVRYRLQSMKSKQFELLLESDRLDPHFTFDKTENTPLHYAVIFSHKKAIQNLLKRQSSLSVKNKFKKSVLDIIDSSDLEKYFDSCLALDNYTPYFSDVNYKMRFRFNCLVDDKSSREIQVVSKIGQHPNLEHLLTHPFIQTFITLKWFKIKFYFWIVLFFQAVMFSLLSILFYRLPNSSSPEYALCVFIGLINIFLKGSIFLFFRVHNRQPIFFVLNRATLHGSMEIFLIVTIIGSFFQNQFRAFIFIEMAISFLLTAGYHPRLSKWSLMLQRVFKTFSILLIFFSLIVLAFSAGFHVLFENDKLFKNFFSAIFKTYIMTAEFNLDDDTDFDSSGFGGYILLLLFGMSMSLVIVNFWTGVAVTDIERIEKKSEINGSKNVILFMLFVDYIFALKLLTKLRKFIPKPLLFLRLDDNGCIFHSPEKCEVDFYVNKQRQFEEKTDFPQKVDDECFNKIRNHYYKLESVTTEKNILAKLEELSKMVIEIKNNCSRSYQSDRQNSEITRNKKDYKKKEKK